MEIDTPQENGRRRKERHRSSPLLPEVRFFRAEGLEIREQSDTNQIVVQGSPIEYLRWYEVVDQVGHFRERMMPGVAQDILPRADVRFLFNHGGLPLARTVAGTMTLSDSSTALQFRAGLDARQQLANDLAIAIQRGDVTQMSCGFIVADDDWELEDDTEVRTINRLADLLDVSAVTYPASPTTHIEVAQRMLMEQPLETRARLRRRYYVAKQSGRASDVLDAIRPLIDAEERNTEAPPVAEVFKEMNEALTDLRAGRVLSDANAQKIAAAHEALHTVLSAAGLVDDDQANATESDGTQGGGNAESEAGVVYPDGSGAREVEQPDAEVREDDSEPEASAHMTASTLHLLNEAGRVPRGTEVPAEH